LLKNGREVEYLKIMFAILFGIISDTLPLNLMKLNNNKITK